jgi:hypothetical protein
MYIVYCMYIQEVHSSERVQVTPKCTATASSNVQDIRNHVGNCTFRYNSSHFFRYVIYSLVLCRRRASAVWALASTMQRNTAD